MKTYTEDYFESINQKEKFWKEQASKIKWFKEPKNILSKDEQGTYKWFEDGELNTSYLCLDVHIENGFGDQIAVIYDSPVANKKQKYSYNQLKKLVEKFAGGLTQIGITKGDRVIIYMPMVVEALVSMLACARIGAIHSVVFGGFAARELAVRIDDAQPKVIISANYGIEFDKIIPYKPLVDAAINFAIHKPNYSIILQRELEEYKIKVDNKKELDFYELINNSKEQICIPVKSTDPLYILYTSGTTGQPKGVVRDNGGHAVAMKYSMEYIYNTNPGDVFWAASDIGWVVGHSYIVYSPLISRCTTIIYEGKPIRTPDAGSFWRIIEEYKVKTFFTAPTAIRAIKRQDDSGLLLKNYDISSLQHLFLAGERCDPPTYEWIKNLLQKPVIDHWWQTESGWAMLGMTTKIDKDLPKKGSAGKPICGYDIQILSDEGEQIGINEEGYVAIKLPLPPSCLLTLWNNNEGFKSSYLEKFPGYYLTGDGGEKDKDGYFYIMGRIDDVINVAGHRLSTGQMEEIVASHNSIAECAVVGITCKLKGQIPVGFVLIKDNIQIDENVLEKELSNSVRDKIGAIACFKDILVVKRLPKTRSGKILRKIIRNIAEGTPFITPSTIEDPAILDEIKEQLKIRKIGIAFE